jgi:hypothetical protein
MLALSRAAPRRRRNEPIVSAPGSAHRPEAGDSAVLMNSVLIEIEAARVQPVVRPLAIEDAADTFVDLVASFCHELADLGQQAEICRRHALQSEAGFSLN